MRDGQDPQEALTPEQRVDLDRVYDGIEHSRFGFSEVVPHLQVSNLLRGAALALIDSRRHSDRPGVYDRAQAYRQAVEDAAAAFERGDLKAAFAAINGAPKGE